MQRGSTSSDQKTLCKSHAFTQLFGPWKALSRLLWFFFGRGVVEAVARWQNGTMAKIHHCFSIMDILDCTTCVIISLYFCRSPVSVTRISLRSWMLLFFSLKAGNCKFGCTATENVFKQERGCYYLLPFSLLAGQASQTVTRERERAWELQALLNDKLTQKGLFIYLCIYIPLFWPLSYQPRRLTNIKPYQ